VDVVHYVFRLTIGDETDEIAGEATARFRFLEGGVTEVFLDLASAAGGKGMKVTAVTGRSGPSAAGASASDGRPVPFAHRSNRLRLSLSAPPRAGEEASFTVQYHGVPADGLRLIPNLHGERTAFSENWPDRARQWLPVIDHPHDKATGEFLVTAPAHYQVVANGLLIEELDLPDGRRQTHWRQSVPIASWLFALGMARFAVHHTGAIEGVPLQSWLFPQDRDQGWAAFELPARQALEFFSQHIGPYPYEKLANVQAAGIHGATEHASAVFHGEKDVAAGRAFVVHELAHQWWGNSVGLRDWNDVWLSEGFATYFDWLFTEHCEGRDAFVADLKRSRVQIVRLERKMPDTPVIRRLSELRGLLNQFVYQKGGWTLHMLRDQVGTEVFWGGIREYYRSYRDANASTDEFRSVMEEVSGKDLSWFFEQWLLRSGVPRLAGVWRYEAALKAVEIELRQTQPGEPFRLAVDIGLSMSGEEKLRVQRVGLAGPEARFTIAAGEEPAAVVLDPHTWVLMEDPEFKKE
jgi:aminopeptidase N